MATAGKKPLAELFSEISLHTDLPKRIGVLPGWENLLIRLGLTSVDLQHINHDNQGLQDKIKDGLIRWNTQKRAADFLEALRAEGMVQLVEELEDEYAFDGDGSTDAGEQFRIADGGKIAGREIDMLQALKQSVGIIRGPGNLQGTGFLLMDNLVMTAFNVIKDIVSRDENGKGLNLQHTKDLSIQFGYQEAKDAQNKETYFNFTPDIQYHNQQLDVVVLKLSPDSKNLPKPFELFSPVQQGMKAHIIGHPQGGILEVDPKIERFELSNEMYRKAVEWSLENHGENGYQGIQDKNKVLFHCRFAHGASGSPGCYTDQTKKQAEVVWMLLEGYPGFHYKNQTYGRQMNVPDEFLIEQGITMEAIWKDMSKEKSDLAQKIFGHRSERFLPILDTCSNAS